MRVVLIEPEIPQNTGNIARLCASTNIELVLVGKLGFSLSNKYLKRSGMDYWNYVKVIRYLTVNEYINEGIYFVAISTKGRKDYSQIELPKDLNIDIVFGCESIGLPKFMYEEYEDKLYKIPMSKGFRSLNLSSSVAIVTYDILKRLSFKGLE